MSLSQDKPLPSYLDGYERAWGLIANARDWYLEGPQAEAWRAAAERWRDEVWHPALDKRRKWWWRLCRKV